MATVSLWCRTIEIVCSPNRAKGALIFLKEVRLMSRMGNPGCCSPDEPRSENGVAWLAGSVKMDTMAASDIYTPAGRNIFENKFSTS